MTDILRKAFTPVEFKLSDTGEVMVAFSRLMVIDHDNDVTFPGAVPVGKSVPISDYGHTSWEGAPPTGKGIISEVGDLGVLTGGFFMETDQGRNAYHTTKAMADLQQWSYGYDVLPPSGPGVFEGQRVRELRKLDIYEISPVLLGSGIGTHTLAIKSGSPEPDLPYAAHASWLREAVTAFTDRTGERAAWRAEEGRGLSGANRDDLAALVKALDEFPAVADELRALLEATDPTKADRLRRTEIDILIASARRNGVTV
jgi:hypothetical protein